MKKRSILSGAEEYPATEFPADVEFWTESFAFWVYSAENDASFFVHFQRQVDDPGIWKSFLVYMLDDGTAYVTNAFGRQVSEFGPGSADCFAHCIEPGKRWVIRFDGAARHVDQAELQYQFLGDNGIHTHLSIQVELEGFESGWAVNTNPEDWGSDFHTEQAHRCKATVRIGNKKERQFEGLGYGDHSRGRRNFEWMPPGMGNFVFGLFDSGRCFLAIGFRAPDGEMTFHRGRVAIGREQHEMVVVDCPVTLEELERVPVRMTGPVGELEIPLRLTDRCMPVTQLPPAEFVIGAEGGFDAMCQGFYERDIRPNWDGEEGVGSSQLYLVR